MGSMYLKKKYVILTKQSYRLGVSGYSPSAKLSPCLPESEKYSLCLLL